MSKAILLLGATGGIGSQVLTRLLERSHAVTVIVREESRLPAAAKGHALLTVVIALDGHLALSKDDLLHHVHGVDTVISCLGHNLSFKGIFRPPRYLCVDTVQRVCEAAQEMQPPSPLKLIVVSTEGVDKLDGTDPKRGLAERTLLGLLWLLLPPHADNMAVVKYLHRNVVSSKNPSVEFVGVRPSDLIDGEPCEFTLHKTLQNGIFNAGRTTRANVGEYMADLATKPAIWQQWRNTFPQILNAVPVAARAVNK